MASTSPPCLSGFGHGTTDRKSGQDPPTFLASRFCAKRAALRGGGAGRPHRPPPSSNHNHEGQPLMTGDPIPTGRFEWERLVRRIVMPKPIKLAALVLATYADQDGTRVRPGMEVLAAVTGDSEKNARRVMTKLRAMGLVEQVSRGGGNGGKGKASEYRLTYPDDLLDRFDMLAPGDKPTASPDIQVSAQLNASPVDNSSSPDIQVSAHDDDQREVTDELTGHLETPTDELSGHSEVVERTSGCPTTTHVHHPRKETTDMGPTQGESRPRAGPPPREPSNVHNKPEAAA